MAGCSRIRSRAARTWHDEGGAGWADGGVALHCGGGIHNAGRGDGHAGGEHSSLGQSARAGGDCEGLRCGGCVSFAVLDYGGGSRAEGSVGCDNFGGRGGVGSCRRGNASGFVGERAWAVGDCEGCGLWRRSVSYAVSQTFGRVKIGRATSPR